MLKPRICLTQQFCKVVLAIFVMLLGAVADPEQSLSAQRASCFEQATTQKEMNDCAAEEFRKADAELNEIYRKVLTKYGYKASQRYKLQKAQRAWIAFRDAHIESVFPSADRVQHGSVYDMCRIIELKNLTTERTQTLKKMLEPAEGDVCDRRP